MVVVTASKDGRHASETSHALRFGERCQRVQNTAARGPAAGLGALIAQLNAQITACEEHIQAKERWETTTTYVTDSFTGEQEKKQARRPAAARCRATAAATAGPACRRAPPSTLSRVSRRQVSRLAGAEEERAVLGWVGNYRSSHSIIYKKDRDFL